MMKNKISDKEFITILEKAVNGDIENIYKIIKIFEGTIINNSIINGRYNQECRDYIEDKIIEQIQKFKKI